MQTWPFEIESQVQWHHAIISTDFDCIADFVTHSFSMNVIKTPTIKGVLQGPLHVVEANHRDFCGDGKHQREKECGDGMPFCVKGVGNPHEVWTVEPWHQVDEHAGEGAGRLGGAVLLDVVQGLQAMQHLLLVSVQDQGGASYEATAWPAGLEGTLQQGDDGGLG